MVFSKILKLLSSEKGLFQVTSGNTIASIIGGLFWLYVASILAVQDYGRLNYYLSAASIVSAFSLLGLQNVVVTFIAKGKNPDIKYQANLLVLISNFLFLPVLYVLTTNLPAMLLVLGLSFYTMSWAEILGNQNYKRFAMVVLSQRALQVLLSLVLFFAWGVDGIIIGYAISAFIFAYNFFKSFKRFTFRLGTLREKKSFIIDSYALAISNSVTNFADKLLVAPLFGFAILGLYQISFQFLLFLSIIPVSMFQFLLTRQAKNKVQVSKAVTGIAMGGAVAFTGIFYTFMPQIFEFHFPQFIPATTAAQIMVIGIIPMTLNAIMASRFLGNERSRPVFLAAIVYLGVLSTLIYLLGSDFGIVGLATAVLVSLVVQAVSLATMTFASGTKS